MGSRIKQKLACCETGGRGHTGVSGRKPRGRREEPLGTEVPHRDAEVSEMHTALDSA